MPRRLPFREFARIYSKVPRLCVEVIVKKRGRVLLTKRDIPPMRWHWHFPGGTVLKNEKLEEAVRRVAKDEVGLDVEVKKVLGVLEFPEGVAYGHTISIAYLVSPVGGKLRGSKQAANVEFFAKIPHKTIHEHAEFLRQHFGMKDV